MIGISAPTHITLRNAKCFNCGFSLTRVFDVRTHFVSGRFEPLLDFEDGTLGAPLIADEDVLVGDVTTGRGTCSREKIDVPYMIAHDAQGGQVSLDNMLTCSAKLIKFAGVYNVQYV